MTLFPENFRVRFRKPEAPAANHKPKSEALYAKSNFYQNFISKIIFIRFIDGRFVRRVFRRSADEDRSEEIFGKTDRKNLRELLERNNHL